MIKQCAWCGATDDGAALQSDAPISHGICDRCADTVLNRLGVPLQRFLESLDAPVLLVDAAGGGRVVTANGRGRDATVREPTPTGDRLLGEVFECVHAESPEGCGRTIHCSGCTIRGAVERTWETGEASYRTPATLTTRDGASPAEAELEVSTERVGGHVLLRIDLLSRREGPGEE